MKCHICKKEIGKQDGNHVYRCAKRNGISESRQVLKHRQLCFETGIELTREFMQKEYTNNLKSLPDFKREFGLNYSSTQFLLRYFSIPARNVQESCNEKRKSKYRKTCTDRYGVVNVSQIDGIKEKKKETTLKNHGVDNIWKKRNFIVQRMIEKYGQGSVPNINGKANLWGWKTTSEDDKKIRIKKMNMGYTKYWNALSDEEKTSLIQKKCSSLVKNFKSSLETRVQKILSDLGISFIWQKWVSQKSFDFQITGTRILIEVQGDFWHCNPSIYKADDIVKFLKDATVKDIWERDEKKKKLAEKYGYRVIYLWESEINSMEDKEIANYLLKEFFRENLKN